VKVTTIIFLQLQSLCNTQLTFPTQPQTQKISSSNVVTTTKLSLISHTAAEIKC